MSCPQRRSTNVSLETWHHYPRDGSLEFLSLLLNDRQPSMASAAPTFSSTKETTNYARLCRLIVDVGTQVFRDTFDAIHAPTNLHIVLALNKATDTEN